MYELVVFGPSFQPQNIINHWWPIFVLRNRLHGLNKVASEKQPAVNSIRARDADAYRVFHIFCHPQCGLHMQGVHKNDIVMNCLLHIV